MSETIQIVPEKINILGIKILGGNITSDPNVQGEIIKSYQVQFGVTDELNYDEKKFRFLFDVNIDALDESDNLIGVNGQYNVEFVFHIENLEYYVTSVDHEKKNIIFHDILPYTLLSIVYSTSRGIVLSRTTGTILDGVILPVINVQDLIKTLEEGKSKKAEASAIQK
ncbi:MAG: hypothetical protein JNJ65_00080 [Cyclobacteriaceae bacterium]|nr:hypothetical protein [Cyclobacteriaceae bacterium]